jgi:tetratricopeptide (TPR) repeat protein
LPAKEARLLHLGFFLEKELDEELQQQTHQHLEECACCSRLLEELQEVEDLRTATNVPEAVCPSSEAIDVYLFDRHLLPPGNIQRLEQHFSLCELCREEVQWLKELESAPELKRMKHKVPRSWIQSVIAAAAALFLAISAFLFWQASSARLPEDELRALAVIQEPEQIDMNSLLRTSPQLAPEFQADFQSAVVAFREKRFSEANQLFKKIADNNPQHSASLFLHGYSLYKLNHLDEAFALCDKAERIKPHSYQRCMFLVNLALKTGNFDRARMEISALYHEAPQVPEVNRLYHRIMDLTENRKIKL